MYNINIFIAGAKNLKELRDSIRVLCMNLNNELRDEYSAITYIETYETLPNYVSEEGPQETYNEYIRTKADIVLFLLHNGCGSITKDEFYVAYKSHVQKKRPPRIYIFKSAKYQSDDSVLELERLLTEIKQYYIEYDTESELKDIIKKEIRSYASLKKRHKRKNLRYLFASILLGACLFIGYLSSNSIISELAHFYERKGKVEKAADYYYELGLKYKQSYHPKAYEHFIKAASYHHQCAAEELLLGADSLMHIGNYDEAYKYYIILSDIGIVDEFLAGLCRYKAGHQEEGKELIRRAASNGNENAVKLLNKL